MATKSYTDFDLLIERNGRKYRARVLNSPAGPAVNEFTLPFSEEKLENFILRLSQGRRVMRSVKPVEVDASREFGELLFTTVFAGTVDDCWRNSLATLDHNQQSLRLRLRLSAAPELVDIPWEYLYDPINRRFLALSVDTPLVRYLDITGRIVPLAVKPPLNVLVMISSPTDVITLDVDQEWNRLKSAVADLEQVGQLRLVRLEKATLEELQLQLRRQDYHVFHYIGHGGYDPRTNDGFLLLEDENGRAKEVSGQTLGTLLHDEKTLRLALLNACEGGRTSKNDPFAGVGQSLLQQGVPAVIAMQFEVTDDTAIILAHSFYTALADGYPVDAALTEARKTIFARNPLEWGTPVLYMRSPDGRIFDVEGMNTATKLQNQLATLLVAGQDALSAKEWSKAEDIFKQAIVLDPTNSAAANSLAGARQGLAQTKTSTYPSTPTSPVLRQSGLFFGIGGLIALLIGWQVLRNWGGINPVPTSVPTREAAVVNHPTNTPIAIATTPPDTDADGLSDPEEARRGTNPSHADSDGDGLTDTEEIDGGSKPTEADTDGDGLNDGDERRWDTKVHVIDSDGDTLSDGEEVHNRKTSPVNRDTDSDGINDNVDPAPGSPPTPTLPPPPTNSSVSQPETSNSCPTRPRLAIGQRAYVNETPPTPNSVRGQPTKKASIIDKIQPGVGMTILDGPQCADGWIWWKVQPDNGGKIGWTSEGGADGYFLTPGDNPSQAISSSSKTNCVGIASPALQIGVTGRVCTAGDLGLRSQPQYNASETPVWLRSQTRFTVLSGPECGDYKGTDFQWWQVQTEDGKTGWLVDAKDSVDQFFLCAENSSAPNGQDQTQGASVQNEQIRNVDATSAFIAYQNSLNSGQFDIAYAALSQSFKDQICTSGGTCNQEAYGAGYSVKEIVTQGEIASEHLGESSDYWTFNATFRGEDGTKYSERMICMQLEAGVWKVFGISAANTVPTSARWQPCRP